MKILNFRLKVAFTLIELLISIAILGILAGVIAFVVPGYLKDARDAQRKNDLQQIQKALESAKNDCLAATYYPIVPSGSTAAEAFNTTADYLNNPAISLMGESVRDPKNTGLSVYTIHYPATLAEDICPDTSGGKTTDGSRVYVVRALLEISNDPNANNSRTSCSGKIGSGAGQIPTTSFNPAPAANDGYFYSCPD